MSFYDCPNCYDIICSCGYKYKDWKEKDIATFLTGLLQYHDLQKLAEVISENTLTHSSIFYATLKLIREIKN